MRTPSKNCALCEKPVSILGAFAQLSQGKLAHASCVESVAYERGYQAGRRAVLDEQAEEQRVRQEKERGAVLAEYEMLTRCDRCGIKVSPSPARYAPRSCNLPSSVPGTCASCVRAEISARTQAIAKVPVQEKKDATKEEAPKRDRFQLLDID